MKAVHPAPGAAAVLALGLIASPVAAQNVFEACSEDIGSFCTDVEPGHGRLMACLYAHEDKVSDTCDGAIGEAADIIDLFFSRLSFVSQQCGEDVRTLCQDVAVGEGRVFSCLSEQKAELSDTCAEVIESVHLPTDQN